MRIAVPHNTTKEKARQIVEEKLTELERQYGQKASDFERSWSGDIMDASVKASGFHLKGTLEITDTDVIIDGKLPLMAKMFEPRIRSTVEKEAAELFRTA